MILEKLKKYGNMLKFSLFIGIVLLANFFPLFNVLSFEYSVLVSISGFLFLGLTIINIKKTPELKSPNRSIIYWALVYLFFPIIPSIVSTLLQGCPLCGGFQLYLTIVTGAFLISILIAFTSLKLSSKFSGLIFFLIFVLILVVEPILEFYFNPQIYFYNYVFNFFPGTIYDEEILIDLKFIGYRLFSICIFILIYFSVQKLTSSFLKKLRYLIVILILTLVYFLKPLFGFSTNSTRMQDNLSNKVSLEKIDIYFDQSINEIDVKNIVNQHKYFYNKLINQLNLVPSQKIESYVFKNSLQKKELFGTGNADVAKPWQYKIFTEAESYDRSLHHELAHAFGAEIGATLFKVAENINPAMIEGFAMALEDNYDNQDLDYIVKEGVKNNLKINFKNMFTGLNFFTNASSIGYIYSGSFIKYLIKNYGIEKVKVLYGEIDFDKVIGKNIELLEDDYYKYINNLPEAEESHKAKLYFMRRPLFKKVCARAAANQAKEGMELYRDGNYKESLTVYEKLYDYSENYSSTLGVVRNLIQLEKENEAEEFLEVNLSRFDSTAYLYNIELNLIDVYIMNGKPDSAYMYAEELFNQNPNYVYKNIAGIRKFLIKNDSLSALSYVQGSTEERYNLLIKNMNEEFIKFSIPSIIILHQALSKTYNEFEKLMNSNDIKVLSSNTLFQLSKYALKSSDYKKSKEYILQAISNNYDDSIKLILEEHLNKVEWIEKNAHAK